MSTRTARIVAALTAAGVVGTVALTVPSATAAAPRATTTRPAQAAAGWLAQQFGDHYVYPGSTSFDGGSTADSIFALAAAKAGLTKIDAALRYFARHVEQYVDIKNADGYGPNDGGIGKTAIAAMVARADPTRFGGYNLLQHLKSDECPAGSTKCTPGSAANIYSSTAESLVILAEARGAKTYGASYAPSAAARAYLLSLQCANGGFTSGTTGGKKCAVDPDSTGFAIMALQADGHDRPALARAVRWLRSVGNADGSWTAQGVHNVDSTGLAAAALAGQGIDTQRSRHWLASQQVTTGPTVGKGASRGALKYHGAFDASSSIKATADGLLGLAAHGDLATLTDTGASAGTAVLALAPARISHRYVRPGTRQSVTAGGFAAGERVAAALAGRSVGSGTADQHGAVTVSFRVPTSVRGKHALVLTGRRSALTTSAVAHVLPPASAPATSAAAAQGPATTQGPAAVQGAAAAQGPAAAAPNLADTGRDGRTTYLEVLLGVGLVGVGTGLVLVGRRRASHR